MDKAAKELGVDEKRVRYWALKLEKQGLIKMNEALGKTILLKNR
jgi:predicted transcriptional regulator